MSTLTPSHRATKPLAQAPASALQSPILLAIDTCTRRASIALRDATTLRAELSWDCARQQTATVAAKLRDLMQACSIDAASVGAVAVSIGPGSFTGVRCGLAIGKGFATARNLPMIGISAFDVMAHAQPNTLRPVYAVVEAGRSRVAVCRYEWVEDELVVTNDWNLLSLDEFADAIEMHAWVCGDVPSALADRIKSTATLAPTWLNLRRAGVLAELAYVRWQRGEVVDAAALVPIYPPD
jgi:tRNA threonylcarbamoyl adenosine modification protein YeaZ